MFGQCRDPPHAITIPHRSNRSRCSEGGRRGPSFLLLSSGGWQWQRLALGGSSEKRHRTSASRMRSRGYLSLIEGVRLISGLSRRLSRSGNLVVPGLRSR